MEAHILHWFQRGEHIGTADTPWVADLHHAPTHTRVRVYITADSGRATLRYRVLASSYGMAAMAFLADRLHGADATLARTYTWDQFLVDFGALPAVRIPCVHYLFLGVLQQLAAALGTTPAAAFPADDGLGDTPPPDHLVV